MIIIDYIHIFYDVDRPAKDYTDDHYESVKAGFNFSKSHLNHKVYSTKFNAIVGSNDNDNILLIASANAMTKQQIQTELRKLLNSIYTTSQAEGYDSLFNINTDEYKEFIKPVLKEAINNIEQIR